MQIHAVPAFQDNYLWVLAAGGQAAVVDPGDAAPVQSFLENHGLKLAVILTTHHHGDHVGGVEQLAAQWRCPVLGPASEKIPAITRSLREGDRVEVPELDLEFEVLDVPGHTAGHIAYVKREQDPVVFCGDTLFACGCGRLFEGTAAQMLSSLSKLASLPPATRVYCAHEYTMANIRFAQAVEPANEELIERKARDAARRERGHPTVPSTIADELATNPFMRWSEPQVIAAAERHAGRKLPGPVEVFAEIRAWKNDFK